jgi:tetratricopeptide (TPR) repeat protein
VVLSNLSTAYRATEQVDRSIEFAEAALAIKPQFGPAHLNLAMALALKTERGRAEETAAFAERAMQHVDQALQINPSYGPGYGMRGRLLAAREQCDEAVVAYLEAARCEPDNLLWLREAAQIHLKRERWQEAAGILESLLRRSPHDADALTSLALAYGGLGRFDDADRLLHQVGARRPADSNVALVSHRVAAWRDSKAPGPKASH